MPVGCVPTVCWPYPVVSLPGGDVGGGGVCLCGARGDRVSAYLVGCVCLPGEGCLLTWMGVSAYLESCVCPFHSDPPQRTDTPWKADGYLIRQIPPLRRQIPPFRRQIPPLRRQIPPFRRQIPPLRRQNYRPWTDSVCCLTCKMVGPHIFSEI